MQCTRVALFLRAISSPGCAFDEYGFPHFRGTSSYAPQPPPFPRKVHLSVCSEGVLDREMIPLRDSPRTSRPELVVRGCGGAWLVVPSTDPTYGPGSFLEPLDGGAGTFCGPPPCPP